MPENICTVQNFLLWIKLYIKLCLRFVQHTVHVMFLHESWESRQSITFVVEKAGEFFNADFIPAREKTDDLFTRIN